MKILLTGINGQLGSQLQPLLIKVGEVTAVGRNNLDLADPNAISTLIDQVKPELIINAAAYTAGVYGAYGKGNFVKTMLRVGKDREELRVVYDQVGCPTWTGDLAEAIAQIIPHLNSETYGTYHYTNSGAISWYDFAIAIFEEGRQLGFPLQVKQVVPITTAEYPTPAKRPAFSVLNSGKISKVLGTYCPYWRYSLKQMLKQLAALRSIY